MWNSSVNVDKEQEMNKMHMELPQDFLGPSLPYDMPMYETPPVKAL